MWKINPEKNYQRESIFFDDMGMFCADRKYVLIGFYVPATSSPKTLASTSRRATPARRARLELERVGFGEWWTVCLGWLLEEPSRRRAVAGIVVGLSKGRSVT
jgi:hypothetical protein